MSNVGRPLKYKNKAELEKVIDKYFNETDMSIWTITGLALALDTTRKTLMEYGNRDEFLNTIKRAKTKIEMAYEIQLRQRGDSGTIFALKNFGWKDKQEIQQTVKDITTLDKVMAQLDDTNE